MNVIDQVMVIYAGDAGASWTRSRPAGRRKWEKQFLTFMRDQRPEVRDLIAKGRS